VAAAVTDYQSGNKQVAFEQLNKLVFVDPENTRILLTFAKLLMKEHAYEQAYSLLEKTPLKNENEEAVVLMTNALLYRPCKNQQTTARLKKG
jgi:thioredoxin-like negative regulator of GroEL